MANILVVDDEMGIRELLSEILSDEGHAIQLAENAQQAREARAGGAPDLVLLDIWMPDTDGVTLLKEWQRDGLLTMPVIMMSGHATIDTAVEATRIGALNFLEKPIALQKLLKAVQQGLTRAQETVRAPVLAPRPAQPAPADEAGHASVGFGGSPQPAHAAIRSGPVGGGNGDSHLFNLSFDLPLREARDAFERMYFEHHLGREGGSMTRVAEKTGLERTHLYRKLKQLGVEPGKLAKKGYSTAAAADIAAARTPTPTTLVSGGRAGQREAAIAAALLPGVATAVILEGLADGGGALAFGDGDGDGDGEIRAADVNLIRIAPGCLCCAGNLVLKVTLNRLLRRPPARLYISLADASHVDQLRAWLADVPYDVLLALQSPLVV